MTYHFSVPFEINLPKLISEIKAALHQDVSINTENQDMYVTFQNSLSDDSQALLATTIENHTAVSNLDSLKGVMFDAMGFGQHLIAEVGAENIILGFNSAQTLALAQKYSAVIVLLLTGSLKTALMLIESLPPDAVVTADRIKKYANEIRAYLGMPLT